MNGTGYPEGLTGERIPLVARILAVADSYEAMTHDRPHRPSLTSRQAVSELIRCADVGYDRRCVMALAKIVHAEDLVPSLWRDDVEVVEAEPALQPA
jgi:HD-GYP domain-containing protein (c-di-GMP phosphodiesterase class II)